MDEQWRARKMEVLTAMPETINLEPLRAKGALPTERLQPEEAPVAKAAPAVRSPSHAPILPPCAA